MEVGSVCELFQRVPAFAKNVFKSLELADLAQCCQVTETWNKFIRDLLIKQDPHLEVQLKQELFLQSWMRLGQGEELFVRDLDYELEMRVEDFQEVKQIFCDDDLILAHVMFTEKFHESKKDHFVFCFSAQSGQCLESIKLKRLPSDIFLTQDLIVIKYGTPCGTTEFQLLSKEFLETVEPELLPNDVIHDILSDGKSLFVVAQEKADDNFWSLYSNQDSNQEHELEEFGLIDFSIFNSTTKRLKFLASPKGGNYLVALNISSGDLKVFDLQNDLTIRWNLTVELTDVVIDSNMLQTSYLALILYPKVDNENAILRVYSAKKGSVIHDYEIPAEFSRSQVQFDLTEKYFLLVYEDSVTGTRNQVIEVIEMNENAIPVKRRIELGQGMISKRISSISVFEERLVCLTFVNSVLRTRNRGSLAFADILNEKWTQRNVSHCNYEVTLFPRGQIKLQNILLIFKKSKTQHFVCQVRSIKTKEFSINLLCKAEQGSGLA